MRRLALIFLLCMAVVGFGTSVGAVPISVTYTADNVIGSWYQDGSAPVTMARGTNYDNWRVADTHTLYLNPGHSYQLVWHVSNLGTPAAGNPAGFLAQINLGDELLLTSTAAAWKISNNLSGDKSDFDDAGWGWYEATSFGTNASTDTNIWENVLGIADDAEWIWDAKNFDEMVYQELFVRATFQTASVPEPGIMLLFSTGLVGLAGLGRKTLKKKK